MNPADVTYLMNATAAAASAGAFHRLGLLELPLEEALAPEEIADRCGTHPRATATLLEAARTVGLVRRDGHRYRAVPGATAILDQLDVIGGLEERVRTGAIRTRYDIAEGADQQYPSVAGHLSSVLKEPAAVAARHLAEPGLEMVDIGAGGAPWSLAIVRRASGCRVTAIDRPAVLRETRERVRRAGHEATYRFSPADIATDDLGTDLYDLALIGNVCHLFGEDVNQSLLVRTFRALRPGGRIAILEPQFVEGSERDLAMYELSLLVRTAEGSVHPVAAYERWMHAAGFGEVRAIPLGDRMSMVLIQSDRPA